MDAAGLLEDVKIIAATFAADRHDRQRRRELDPSDFAELHKTGYLLTGVPIEHDGLFESVPRSTRPIAEILRALAKGDSSLALVSSMHPAVLAFWLATPSAPEPHAQAWAEQRSYLAKVTLEGAQFGTITSEPGSGGDVSGTKAVAKPGGPDGTWLLSGQKHFGSGSGITSFMLTSGRPEGEDEPDWFYLDMRGVPWDGSRGVTLTAPWDGHGMAAIRGIAVHRCHPRHR
ncbi:MAG: acyl-CoA/acyl-ACP dehydrogenase [Actinobacteria bacterium]|nr:acyl-CoA/acyl-ACP dehydrogenase [Actinomycetota bacterium]